MTAAWSTRTTIENLWIYINDSVEYATAGDDAPSYARIIRITYNTIFATEKFATLCREWCRKLITDKTCTNLELHFKAADKNTHAITNGTSGYTVNVAVLSDITQARTNIRNNNNITQFANQAEASRLLGQTLRQ
jgi:hypothetical protein